VPGILFYHNTPHDMADSNFHGVLFLQCVTVLLHSKNGRSEKKVPPCSKRVWR
jgi:hypothetical protein